ncbi:MAG: hypothetical protein J0L80_01830 [Chitinophagales bacterium]|nr:hypothetical protein [Chitinophagales bacterium]
MDDKEYEKQYTAGYNSGYILSRFEPTLFKHLQQSPATDDPYLTGIKDGGLQHQQSLYLENLQKARQMSQQSKPRHR